MASFHTLKASAPLRPDKSGAPKAPDSGHYFGSEAVRRLGHPPAPMARISRTDVTPGRISRAMNGEPVFPGMPVMEPEHVRLITQADAESIRLRREREVRQRIEEELRDQGNGGREKLIPGAFGRGRERL
jgi:hypothetical protein